MSYKSILVHLDTSARAHERLKIALQLAHQFDARLIGVFSTRIPDPHGFLVNTAECYMDHKRQYYECCKAMERLFHAELARAQVKGEWVAVNGHANEAVPPYTHLVDLIIVGQTDPKDPESFIAEQFVEHIVLCAGRPVLVVPSTGPAEVSGKHVLIAWDGSREATRAIHDAMPLLGRAKNVTLLTVNAMRAEPPRYRIPGADIALTVARHGVKIDVREITVDQEIPVGEVLLAQAMELGCGLIVMGGYAHSRLHELILGGVTRTILESMTVPVLLSH